MAEARLTAIVSTKGVKKGSDDLKAFTRAANDSEKKVDKLAKKTKKAEGSFKSFGKNAAASIATINGPLGGISSRVSSLVTVLTSGTAIITGLAIAVTSFGAATAFGVKKLDELNVASAKTEAILKATGNAVGLTSEQLNKQARDIALNTLASVEGIQQAQAVLLTFNRVQGETSTRALELSQDLAAVFGGTAASQATSLGKALQDPTKGISALSRVGVTFTSVQKEQIKLFQETGEAAKAQQIILEELTNQVGGAGGAVATGTLAGAFDTAGQLFSEFAIQLAKNSGAYDTTLNFVNGVNEGLKGITERLENDPLRNLVGDGQREQRIADLTSRILEEKQKINQIDKTAGSAPQSSGYSYGGTTRPSQGQTNPYSYITTRDSGKIVADLELELKRINEAIAAEDAQFEKQKKAQADSALIAKKQKEDDLAEFKAKEDEKARILFDKAKLIADRELAAVLVSNDTELEAVNRKEADKLALFQSYRDRDLISAQEYESAKLEIELGAKDRRAEIRAEEIESQRAATEEQNALIVESGDIAASAISSGFLEFAKGQKSAKDATLDVIGSVSEAIFNSLAQQVIKQQIVDRIVSAGFIKTKAAEASTATAQASQNAFAATAGAPYPLNLGAPAAAAAAAAASAALGASVVAAASAREQGGSLNAGQSSTFAERGQLEILTPASNSRVRTAQQMKGIMGESQSQPQVSLVVIDQSEGSKTFEESTDDEGRIVLLIRSTVSNDIGDANSQISKSFSNSTNVQRAGR